MAKPDPTSESNDSDHSLALTPVPPDPEAEPTSGPEPSEPPTLADALTTSAKHRTFSQRIRHTLIGTKKRAFATIVVILLIIGGVIGLTPLKYSLFGSIFTSNVDVRISDKTSHQLLPGATVVVAGASAVTDKTGIAHFSGLHAGKTTIVVTKAAYDSNSSDVTLGFGDGGTKEEFLSSNGIKLSFKLTNYVSDMAVSGARLKLGDADAVSDKNGLVTASLPASVNGQTIPTKITADGFNDATVNVAVKVGAATVASKLVPTGQAYYLSNRSGRIDLYGSNLDGSSASVLLVGTGKEDGSTGILPNVYDQSVLALVSSRAGTISNGAPEEDLFVFRPGTKDLTLVDKNISFSNYRTWLGKQLIYIKFYNENGSQRSSIQAYDPNTGKNTTVVTCTGDGACPAALYSTDDLFIYSLSGAPAGSSSNGIYAVSSSGTTSKSISKTPATSATRQTKNVVLLQYYGYNQATNNTQSIWQSLDLASTKVTTAQAPTNTNSRTYISSPGDKYSVSIDKRDGQSDLYVTDDNGANERQLTATGKVDQFVQWYGDDYIVYSSENQLFVVAISGGDPRKITNFYSGDVRTYSGGYSPND